MSGRQSLGCRRPAAESAPWRSERTLGVLCNLCPLGIRSDRLFVRVSLRLGDASRPRCSIPLTVMPAASASMDVDKPPKFVLDDFIATALSGTPAVLHPFFESFRKLYTQKYALRNVGDEAADDGAGYGINLQSNCSNSSTIPNLHRTESKSSSASCAISNPR